MFHPENTTESFNITIWVQIIGFAVIAASIWLTRARRS